MIELPVIPVSPKPPKLSEPPVPSVPGELPKPHQRFPSEEEEAQSDPHYEYCARFVVALKDLFVADLDANAGGDQAFYWNTADDRERVAPDAYLIRGCDKEPRKSFKLWEEKAAHPNFSIRFFLEVWSESNRLRERREKLRRYESWRVTEFLELEGMNEAGTGGEWVLHRLDAENRYAVAEPEPSGRLFSRELGTEIAFEGNQLRLYRNGEKIPTALESQAQADFFKAQAEASKAQAEASKAQAEASKAQAEVSKAEAERLRAEVERLRKELSDRA